MKEFIEKGCTYRHKITGELRTSMQLKEEVDAKLDKLKNEMMGAEKNPTYATNFHKSLPAKPKSPKRSNVNAMVYKMYDVVERKGNEWVKI